MISESCRCVQCGATWEGDSPRAFPMLCSSECAARARVAPGYETLAAVLDEALDQAQAGKGLERHSRPGDLVGVALFGPPPSMNAHRAVFPTLRLDEDRRRKREVLTAPALEYPKFRRAP